MLPMRAGWQGTMQNHAEPCRYVGTFAFKKLLNHNLHLDKGFVDQIRCCLCARDDREPCRTMQNHADRWGLSHLEPPKSQPTQESKSGWCANMFLDKGFIDQIRCCLCERDGREPCRTMQNHADMWGLSHSKSS